MVDPFTVAYVSGAATLAVAELWAVARSRGGTITDKTKGTPVTHAAMASLLGWGLYHFTADDYLDSGVSLNVLVAAASGLAGLAAYRHRNR